MEGAESITDKPIGNGETAAQRAHTDTKVDLMMDSHQCNRCASFPSFGQG